MTRYTVLRARGDVWEVVDSYANPRGAADDFLGRTGSDIDPEWIAADLAVGCAFERESRDGVRHLVTGTPLEHGAVYDGMMVA